MEVTQEARSHAASLLESLNLQRERAQFCDCVVRQRQNPGQLHPAHRCVLAASSPVLASILSSTGALVELQAPCLSDSVLALLLDYIYTGALPYNHSQHQYYNLLTAASYLQMDELQETLRTWQQTDVKTADDTNASAGAENQPYEDIGNASRKTVNTFSKYLPLSLEREYHQYSASVDTSTLSDVSSISESTESTVNAGYCGQVTHLTPQDLIQNIPCTTEVDRVSAMDKEMQRFHSAHSAGTVKPEPWLRSTGEELERTVEDRRNSICTTEVQKEETSKAQQLCLTVESKAEKQTNREEEDKTLIRHSPLPRLSTSHLKDNVSPSQCSSSSSPSPHPCRGAVPVICHSSRAALLKLEEVSPMPPYHSVSQASVSSSSAPNSRSGSTYSDGILEDITTRDTNNYGAQNVRGHTGTHSWDCKGRSNQSDILQQDYNSSNTDHLIRQNGEHMSNGLSHLNDHHAHCDSFQKKNHTKHLGDDSVPLNKDCSNFTRRLKYQTDLRFDDFSSKHQRLDCSDCQNVWMATGAEEQSVGSQDPRAVVSLPQQDSETGSDSHCGDLLYRYSRCPAETERQDSRCNSHRAETSTKAAAFSQHEHHSDSRDTARTDTRHSVDDCRPVSTTPGSCLDRVTGDRTSVELGNMSGTEITEPHLTFTMPVDHNMSDSTCSVVGPSYRGHLRYHCLPQEETSHVHSRPRHPDCSDQSSEEEEVASPGYSPLRQHFATGTTNQVLLLDISAKPAELLVANACRQKETFGHGFGNKWNAAVAGVDTKSWVEEKKSVDEDQSRPGAGVIHKAGVEERVSNPKEGDKQTTTTTLCTPLSVPDYVQASLSSTLSICIPSTLSPSMPTNISADLPNPVHHPFQCSLCDRSFSQRGSLNRHVRSHLGVRPFPCPRCPMTFSRQYRVIEHMRVHQRCVLGSDFPQPPASTV